MAKKCTVEIVGGFLSWGKTSFINAYLEETLTKDEKVLIMQCEKGNTEIRDDLKSDDRVVIKEFSSNAQIDKKVLNRAINFHEPHRIIIEANGVQTVNNLIENVDASKGTLGALFVIVDGRIIEIFLKSMGAIILSYIHRANMIIINNCGDLLDEKKNKVEDTIMNLNKDSYILISKSIDSLQEEIKSSKIISKGIYKMITDYFKNMWIGGG